MYTSTTPELIRESIANGQYTSRQAIKNKSVKAIQLTEQDVQAMLAVGGYQTVFIDEQGKTHLETVNKKIKAGDWLLTNQIEGHDNSYIISDEKFAKLYEATSEVDIFKPISGVRTVYILPDNHHVSFEAPWGGTMYIRSGGVLVADGDKFYGINPEEFKSTYSFV